ncbi:hypothetical protein D3C71_1094360 [compost metagenome]
MAIKLGMSHSNLSYIESGKYPIPSSFYDKVVEVYGLTEKESTELLKIIICAKSILRIEMNHLPYDSKELLLDFVDTLSSGVLTKRDMFNIEYILKASKARKHM